MNTIQKLLQEVSTARSLYLDKIDSLSADQALWKPNPEVWNIIEITEHLYWAEQMGVLGMWKTLHAIRDGSMVRTHESTHKGMTIEKVIALTWQTKEKVPVIAAPRFGGPLSFWRTAFKMFWNHLPGN